MDFKEIRYVDDSTKSIESINDPNDYITLWKDLEYFDDGTKYTKFIKQCEQGVRRSKEYKAFINYIKNILGFDFCMVSSHIYGNDATIEMHHGPIFTLYDIVMVVLEYFIKKNKRISTFRIVDCVIDEHFDLCVQVVMLAITNHEAVHNKDLFLNVRQGIGDLNSFILKYKDYLTDIQKYKIWYYINMCKSNPSFDKGYLDIQKIEKEIKL